jgi:hypothetical protein
LRRRFPHRLTLLVLDHSHGHFHQVSHHRLHIAADVPHLGEFAGLHLAEWGLGQLGQPSGDLGLADTRRADHEDVLGQDFFGQAGVQLLAAPAIA